MKLTYRQIESIHNGHIEYVNNDRQANDTYQAALQRSKVTGEVVKKTFLPSATCKHRISRNEAQLEPFVKTLFKTQGDIAEEVGAVQHENQYLFYDPTKRQELTDALAKAKKPADQKKAEEALKQDHEQEEARSKEFHKKWNDFLDSEEEAEEIDLRKVPLSGFENDTELSTAFFSLYQLLIED
jgi:cellobiose phosphorylase